MPQNKYIKNLFKTIDFNFKAGHKQFITAVKYRAKWVTDRKQVSIDELIDLLIINQSLIKRLRSIY